MRTWLIAVLISLVGICAPAFAEPYEARVPLNDGKVHSTDLSAALCRELRLPASFGIDCGSIDLTGIDGSLFLAALNASLGDGCRLFVAGESLVIRVDPENLPQDCEALKKATRLFTAIAAPGAARAQADLFGLKLPEPLNPKRPLVVLVHGLDCDRGNWSALTRLLTEEGFQVACFTYPSDQPIADSAAFFGRHLSALHQQAPDMPIHVLAHSMGGLVARAYIEGDTYAGGVKDFIMIGTPNRGSKWARARMVLEVEEHYHLWKHEPNWHWTWMITDGLGEAGTDLKPGSDFLKELNARPRRKGVTYTVIAGSQHPASRMSANCLDKTAGVIRGRAAGWWGLRHCKAGLEKAADKFAENTGDSDGPVKVSRAKLKGVDDFVVLPVDHASLYLSRGDKPPAAWAPIRERLKN